MRNISKDLTDFIVENQSRFYHLAYSYVKNPDDALDVVSEAVVRAMQSSENLKKPEYMKTWFYRIVINTSLSYLKKKSRVVYLEDAKPKNEPAAPDDYRDLDLQEALDALDEKYRIVIILHYFEDFTLEQTAKTLGISCSTAKTRLYAGLEKLKRGGLLRAR